MRSSTVAILVTLSSLAVAQDILGSLPKCGQECFGNNFAGCGQFDFKCICGNTNLISELSCCVSTKCNDQDKNTIIKLASGLCQGVGVDVPTQASCAPSATFGSSSSTNSAITGSSTGTASTTSAPTTTSAPATTSGTENQGADAQSSTGSSGIGGPAATANAGLGLAMGMAGLLAAL
ncbi:hypothetical protein GRF29_1536g1509493 [Pseudopithomyces chartarum]|uniref:CFEM domain-containing protein n=1 Tax=Pseudopithomyces chartarum TaxID=1892770 RepID=A0AAN6LME5_9PLEO|nr:hypothetical protein GRF29_1536g1509493 [Pseudopithomyces chartarum]